MSATESSEQVVRFTRWARYQHQAITVLFIVLLVTGLPQKWPQFEASHWMVDHLGGIFAARWWHRMAGLTFALLMVAHLATAIAGIISRRVQPTMLFTRKDFYDAIENLGYFLGRREHPPKFGRYDYRQKFEYWGLVFGSMVMVGSGFILYYPIDFARLLPAELIPAAKAMHSNEALLALVIILVWHMYGAHLSPEVFPLDRSIFTGKISKDRLKHEHALEYEELFGQKR